MDMSEFIKSVAEVAYLADMEMREPRTLEDGYTELVFFDKHDPESEMSIAFKEVGEFRGSTMLEVRFFTKTDGTRYVYISAVPYVLFGVMYNEI